MKEKNPKLKTLLSIGGWNSGSAQWSEVNQREEMSLISPRWRWTQQRGRYLWTAACTCWTGTAPNLAQTSMSAGLPSTVWTLTGSTRAAGPGLTRSTTRRTSPCWCRSWGRPCTGGGGGTSPSQGKLLTAALSADPVKSEAAYDVPAIAEGNHTIPYHTKTYHTIPFDTLSYHTIPLHSLPYPSNFTKPFHILPHYPSTVLDLFNIMDYDYHGGWEEFTGGGHHVLDV